jgi:Asp-tRNA(Asn)/Glu-tRNA(Gln) amidotransferase C subunit
MRRFVAGVAVAALLIAAGCGDDDGDGGGTSGEATEEFCQGFNRINEQFSDINPVTNPDALREALDMLRDLDPPEEIADEYETVLEGFERLSEIDVTDQNAVNEVRDDLPRAEEAFNTVGDFVDEKC